MPKQARIETVQAPHSVSWLTERKLRRQGRQDARNYKSLNDYTRTHTLIVAQNRTNAGQRRVNQWVIQAIDPYKTGNARILIQLEALEDKLSKLAASSEVSGRKQRELAAQTERVEKQTYNFSSQYQTNVASAQSILLQGEQAINSWENYYRQLAGIYTRARAAKLKIDVTSVEAEVPELESVELVDIPEFQELPASEKKAGKK